MSANIYNIFNSNTILGWNNTYGSVWQRPNRIMRPRFARIGFEIEW